MSITNVLPFPGPTIGHGPDIPTADQLIVELQEALDLLPIEASDKVLLVARVRAIAMRSYLFGTRHGAAVDDASLRITTSPA